MDPNVIVLELALLSWRGFVHDSPYQGAGSLHARADNRDGPTTDVANKYAIKALIRS